jgi:hypothetical protein
MDLDGPWHWNLSAATLREIHAKLSSFETMTWGAISGHRHHYLATTSVCKKAMNRLQQLKQDDAADLLFSFALSGRNRLVGIRAGREFRILWWDPGHEVSPWQKPHT